MSSLPYINLNMEVNLPGQPEDGSQVRFVRIKAGNTLANFVSAGFLNPLLASQGLALYASDFVFVAASDGNQIYKPTFGANGVVTLAVLP